jgi:hypothetical protein
MNYPEKIQELLHGFKISKGVRSLTLEEQSILKVAVIMRNDTIIELMDRLLKEEQAGKEIDLVHLKGVVEDFSGRHEGGEIAGVREAAAKKEEEKYLDELMKEMNG